MPDHRPLPDNAGDVDDDPTPPRGIAGGRPDAGGSSDDPDARWDDEEWDEPNFLVRRALVIGGVVIVIALGAIGIGRLIGGDDSSSTSSAAAVDWDTIVVLETDEIRLVDPSNGDEIETYAASDDLLDAQSLVADHVLVTMTDAGQIVQTDLADGSQRQGRSGPDETLVVSPDHPAIAISGNDLGGDISIIDTRDRSTLSVADVAGLDDPLIFSADVIVNPSATHVAVPVPNAFQSVVIDLADSSAQARAGRVIAIDDERIVTEQPAGDESELEFYDIAGERLGSIDVAAPKATLLRDDGRILAVSTDGTITIVDADGSVDEVGSLSDPDDRPIEVSSGERVADGDRLVVVGTRDTYVLESDGTQIASAPGAPARRPGSGERCIVAVSTSGRESATTVLDVESGSVVAEIEDSFVTDESYDGCTIAFQGTTPQLLSDGELTLVDAASVAVVAPDGTGYVVIDGRDSEYVALGDDPLEIADRPTVIHFGNR
ncbi:hypothetical protein [Ilumatobacter sp.]|uniref:hypothetical protein n=1 Tax=Ilumatobacter sp. TaxID=1967498 RepID=UPI003C31CE80